MLERLRKYFRSKGFGVHSPFAFRFIRECLEEKLPYYDYVQLKTDNERLMYRIAVFFQPSEIISLAGGDIKAARKACRKGEHKVSNMLCMERTRLVVAGSRVTVEEIKSALTPETVIVVQHPEGKMPQDIPSMRFILPHHHIIVAFPHLPAEEYRL